MAKPEPSYFCLWNEYRYTSIIREKRVATSELFRCG